MKNKLFNLAAIVFVSGILLTGCNIKGKNSVKSQDMVEAAKENVAEANLALNSAIEQFKEESAEAIEKNEDRIANLKIEIANENEENKVAMEEKLAELEQKNKELKEKLADYKNDGSEKWDAFKVEFNHDINELGKAFSDLTIKNTN
jgi:polyhydroxyalkanoate synthesis regulator phasin